MRIKLFSITIGFILIITFALFFLLSHSYKLSLEAKVHYYLSHYEKAHTLAKEAHALDKYNRMAATVMTQSQLALVYVNYIKDAKGYLEKIKNFTQKKFITKGDRVRMKFMAEIMMERHEKLTPTVVIDEGLKNEAKTLELEFKKIHEKVTSTL